MRSLPLIAVIAVLPLHVTFSASPAKAAEQTMICKGEVAVGTSDSVVGDCSFESSADTNAIFDACQMGDICTVEAEVEDRGGDLWIRKVIRASRGDVDQSKQIEQVKVWFRLFTTAQYCGQRQVSFTSEEIDAYTQAVKSATAEFNLPRSDIDNSWEDVQRWFVQKRRDILTEEDCALVKRSLQIDFPNAIQRTYQKNPF